MKKLLLFAVLLLTATFMQAQNLIKADTHSLKIMYLFASDFTEAHESFVAELAEGEEYKQESPEIVGYTPDKPIVEGKMEDHDILDTVLYTAIPNEYVVTTKSMPEEGGTTTGGGTFEEGDECTVTAEANDGYFFVNWTENGEEVSNRTSYSFTVDHDSDLVANFEQDVPTPPTTHTVAVNPLIIHGTVTVSPSGEVEVGTRVTITATPDEGYELNVLLAYNKDNVSETVEIENSAFVMPDFDVMVTASFEQAGSLPLIEGNIEVPATICAGQALELQAPTVSDADEQGWQMSATDSFDEIEVYNGQNLDVFYNGWKLRYMASNALGEVYSNVVTITVKDMDNLTLVGESSSCTGLECTYNVDNAVDVKVSWTVSDASAIVTASGSSIVVRWGTKGRQEVKALVEDNETGCSAEVEMEVTVQSYINESDVNAIVVKKHNGVAYLLIYPNPKDTYKYQWYKDDEPISGANGQYYYPANGLAEGNYQVYISYNADAQGNLFCGAFSPVLSVSTAKADFAIYPNPAHAHENLVVVNNTERDATMLVYSDDGRLVHMQTIAPGSETLAVALPQGVYMLQLNDGKEVTMQKVVIQ